MPSARGERQRRVVIIGAGIAGMTAALYLARAGFEVEVLERNGHLGGKFGATVDPAGMVHEHAYHFLGDWCENFWLLVKAIGLDKRRNFRQSNGVKFLRPIAAGGTLPQRLSELRLGLLKKDFTMSLDGGVVPPDDLVIWCYSLLDLISYGRDLDEKEFLNRISVNGFMRSLPYMTDRAALLHQEALVKAFAVPSYETSARSYRQFARFFGRDQDGWILSAPVNQKFWPRFEQALAETPAWPGASKQPPRIRRGTTVRTIEVVPRGRSCRVSGVTLSTGKTCPIGADDFLLLTLPHRDVASLVDRSAGLRSRASRLLDLRNLPAKQMASLDLCFRHPLPDIPAEHVTLIDDHHFKAPTSDREGLLAGTGNRLASRFALSFIDNYQAWHSGPRRKTWLNVVSADFEALTKLPEDDARPQILCELKKYLAFDEADIDAERTDLRLNVDQLLFTNSVGTWQNRPEPGFYRDPDGNVPVKNLALAGDYCRSEVDLVCLEGAVLTAIRAADELAEAAGRKGHVPEPVIPAEMTSHEVETLKRDLEPWLRLAFRRAFGARRVLADPPDPLGRLESRKRLLDLAR
jgi:flavin-dependent amine oxidoreductase